MGEQIAKKIKLRVFCRRGPKCKFLPSYKRNVQNRFDFFNFNDLTEKNIVPGKGHVDQQFFII